MIQLDDKTRRAKGREFVRLIEQDAQDRLPALDRIRAIRNIYYGTRKRQKRWKGQSDIQLPVLAEKIESFITKEMNAFWAAEPHVHARRLPIERSPEETEDAEKIVNYAVETDIPNFYRTFESWLRNRHLDSVAAAKIWYNYEERFAVFTEQAETLWRKGQIDFAGMEVPEDRPKLPQEIIMSHFARADIVGARRNGKEVDPLEEQDLDGLELIINFVENQIEYTDIQVLFRANRKIDTIDLLIYRPYPVKDNVEVDLIEFDDLIVPYRAKDLQTAPRISHKYWLTYDEIQWRRDHEDWELTDEDMKHLRARARAIADEDNIHQDSSQLKEQADIITGQQRSQGSASSSVMEPYSNDKVLILECYVRDDLDEDGIPEELIYQIPYALETIVHAKYLETDFPHGRRPIVDLHSIPISNRYLGWSLGQILAPINLEVDTIINTVNDAQELINNPFFFYVPTALPGDKKRFERLYPGKGIAIADPNGVIFPKFPQEPLANLSTMDSLLLFADRLTVSPQAVGSSQVRNAPRTARGTLALLSEAGARIDSFITAAQKGGWAEMMYQIYALYEIYCPSDKWEQITGRPKGKRMRPIDLHNRLKFVFKGNSVNTNREVMRTIAQVRFNTLMSEPLYASDPIARRALIEDFLRHFSEGVDIQKLLPRLPSMGGERQPLPQESEIKLMEQGKRVDVLPIDDDTKHMLILDRYFNSKQFENISQDIVILLGEHYQQHQRQLLMKQQSGQVGAGGTQGNNVPLGITQDLNSLEGGIV